MASLRERWKLLVLVLVLVTVSVIPGGEGDETCAGKLSTFTSYSGKDSTGYDLSYFNSTLDLSDTLTSCKTACTENCTCVAFLLQTYNDGADHTCWFKRYIVSASNLTLVPDVVLYVRQNASLPPSPPPPLSTISPPPPPSPPPPSELCPRRLDTYTKYNDSRLTGYDIEQLYLTGTEDETLDQCQKLCTVDCDCVAFNLFAGYSGDYICAKKFYVTASLLWEAYEDSDLYVRTVVESTCEGSGLTDEYQSAISNLNSDGNDLPGICFTTITEDHARIRCQELCSGNCSCVGFVFDNKQQCCYQKYSIVDEASRKYLENNDLYIRINVSSPPPPFPPPPPPGKDKSNALLIGVIVGSTAALTLLLALLGFCCFQRYRRAGGSLGEKRVKQILLSEIAAATKNFSKDNILGEGGYGTVYVGVTENGEKWAVKRAINASIVSLQAFKQEVELISQMSHTNIVNLLGYCDEGAEQILVYEYMEKGSLKKLLHDDEEESLTFQQRVEIAIDVAEGLRYLHHYAGATVIHRDIKSDNILVNSNFKGKIADFGLLKDNPATVIDLTVEVEPGGTQGYIKMESSKNREFSGGSNSELSGKTKIAGTPGYIDPAYVRTSQVSTKSDVYSFGVVLFELITGRRALVNDDSAPENDPTLDTLVHWIQPHVKHIESIADPKLGGNYHQEALRKLTRLGIICTEKNPENRPTMEEVEKLLAQIKNTLLNKQAIDLDDTDERETADTSPRQFPIMMGSSDSNFIVPMSQTVGPR